MDRYYRSGGKGYFNQHQLGSMREDPSGNPRAMAIAVVSSYVFFFISAPANRLPNFRKEEKLLT